MKYFIDCGSSTIKTYCLSGRRLDLINGFSILFKDGFTKEGGVAADKIAVLISHFETLAARWRMTAANTKLFATGIWREVPAAQISMLREKSVFGFNVISHDEEARALQNAAAGLDFADKKAMIINMGGKTTEIVSRKANAVVGIKTLNFGVADLLNRFPQVNEPIAKASPEEMAAFCAERLTEEGVEFDTDFDFALFTGELRFEQLSGYPLRPNTVFKDANHPSEVSLDGFIEGTRRIFFDLTMDSLRALMPENPGWMVGARAGAVLPLAIFERARIKIIVPSDLNLINGMI
jgi:hypothetical protein